MDWSDRIGRRIRLRDLHIVLAVAESGSMTKASAKLAISHPVVSKTISDLEHTLGVRLFDRNPQGVELTAYGRALLKCGVNVFDEMRQGLKQIEFLTDPTSGELAVGCPEIIIAGILPAIAEQFLQQYPAVKLRVIHADTALMQLDQLRERNVELLIGRMPRPFIEDDLVANSCSTNLLLRSPECTAGGRGAGVSNLPNLQKSLGFCRPPRARPDCSLPRFFRPPVSRLRSQASSHCPFN